MAGHCRVSATIALFAAVEWVSLSSILTSGTSRYAAVEVRRAAKVYITPIDVQGLTNAM